MTTRGMSKAGPVTLALGLIGGGLALLLYNLGAVESLTWMWKLWPVLLIGIGVEYFIKKAMNKEEEVHFHVPSIILILVLVMIGGAAYAATSVGRNLDRFLEGVPWPHNERMTYSRNWESEKVPVGPGDLLVVENRLGLVELHPAEGNDMQVRAEIRAPETGPARERAESSNPEIKREDGRVLVTTPGIENRNDFWNRIETNMKIMVPDGVNVEVKSATGRVVAEGLAAELQVEGSTGTVEIANVTGDINIDNNTGRIIIKNPGGDVTAETTTGSVELSSDIPLEGNYDLKSNTGRVSFRVPGDSNLAINAVSRTGNISVTGLSDQNIRHEGTRSEYSKLLGQGKGKANLEVSTGSIHITVR